jgi:hypothetical protein
MPKCLYASLDVFTPRSRTVFEPVGARRASWSRVKAAPPAATMRSRAALVKRRAATVILGTVVKRMSLRTWTTILGVLAVSFAIREGDAVVFREEKSVQDYLDSV